MGFGVVLHHVCPHNVLQDTTTPTSTHISSKLQGSFVLFWLVFLTANAISVAFAYLVASASPNLDVANAVVPAFMMVMLFFAGFLILVSSIPGWLRWIVKIDFLKYGFTALQQNYWVNINEPIIDFDRIEQTVGKGVVGWVMVVVCMCGDVWWVMCFRHMDVHIFGTPSLFPLFTANRTADFVATLPDRLNIPLLRNPPSPMVASPSPGKIYHPVHPVLITFNSYTPYVTHFPPHIHKHSEPGTTCGGCLYQHMG